MSAAVRSSSNGGTVGQQPSLSISKPTGTADGDGLIAFLAVDQGSGVTITPPAGWTLVGRTDQATALSVAVYRKVASGEGASWGWSFAPNAGAVGVVAALTLADATNPAGPVSGTATAAVASQTTPSLIADPGDRLLFAYWAQLGLTSLTGPSGLVQMWNTQGGGITQMAMYQAFIGSGPTGQKTCTSDTAAAFIGVALLASEDERVTKLLQELVFDDTAIEEVVFA